MRTLRTGWLAVALALAGAQGPVSAAAAQDDGYKPVWLVPKATKVSFTEDDRHIASEYLADHRELRAAPRGLATALRATGRWSAAFDPYTTRVPKRLEQRMSELPAGFVRRVFDRTMWLVSVDTGEVVDRVEAED